MKRHPHTVTGMVLAVLWLSTLPVIPVEAQQGATDGDAWGTKYAPFDQINGDNFGDLEVAWRWRSADTHLPYESEQGVSLVEAETLFDLLEAADPDRWVTRPSIGRLSATPLMVDGVLYLATPLYQAAAIDARTGETLWVHNPRVYESGSPPLPAPWNHRGVAYWEEGDDARIIWGTGDGALTAVDARTGLLATEFGHNGRVDLEDGLPPGPRQPESAAPSFTVATGGRGQHDHRRLVGPRLSLHEGERTGLRSGLRRGQRAAQVGLPQRASERR